MSQEALARLLAFAGVFSAIALWELAAPRRPWHFPRWPRWRGNLMLVVLDTLMLRLIFPAGAVAVAAWGSTHHLGLLAWLRWPPLLEAAIAIVALDFVIYMQHRLFHRVPLLWRMHMVHHADRELDVSSGLRFHPLEILVSFAIKCAAILALGAPPMAVLAFEVILNAMAMFNHGNVRLPSAWDRLLRLCIVTPDMHRVHHSVHVDETNSNYGFNLSLWDRCFGTYRDQPQDGHLGMTIGLAQFRQSPTHALGWMLRLPWSGEIGQYPGKRKGWRE